MMDVSQRLFDGLGEYGRLWWVHRKTRRTMEFGNRLIGKESLAGFDAGPGRKLKVKPEYQVGPDGKRKRPMPKWSPEKVRTMAAREIGMKDESDVPSQSPEAGRQRRRPSDDANDEVRPVVSRHRAECGGEAGKPLADRSDRRNAPA